MSSFGLCCLGQMKKREAGLSVQVLVFICSTKAKGQVLRPYGTDKQHQAQMFEKKCLSLT